MSLSARIGEFRNLTPEQIAAETSRTLPFWVSVLLVVLIAWQLARLTWMFLPQPAPDTTVPPADATPATSVGADGNLSAQLREAVEAHLFGEAPREAPPPAPDPVDAPDTTLNLTLSGTLTAIDSRESLAIISERGSPTKVFAIGDVIRTGTKLHSVYPDRVLLDRSGKIEALRLPKELGEGEIQAIQPRASESFQARTGTSVRQLIDQNAASLTEVIRPQPVFADGKQRGYRVYPGRQRQAFSGLGLRPGDLITEINGVALDDPTKGMEIFRSLGDATSVTVTVERNGQPEVLVLDTSELGNASDQDDE
jgi:general secretion pathway protein C